jgi:hypothetical protein
MKSFEEMAKDIRWGDHKLVADVLGVSEALVKMVAYGERKDHRGIKLAFNILLAQREEYETMMNALEATKEGVRIKEDVPVELREEMEAMLRVFNVNFEQV